MENMQYQELGHNHTNTDAIFKKITLDNGVEVYDIDERRIESKLNGFLALLDEMIID